MYPIKVLTRLGRTKTEPTKNQASGPSGAGQVNGENITSTTSASQQETDKKSKAAKEATKDKSEEVKKSDTIKNNGLDNKIKKQIPQKEKEKK